MANISSPTIIKVKNAADAVVVPATRVFKFTGGLVVTQVAPGQAEINGVGSLSAWSVLGNAGAGLVLGTTTNDSYKFIQNGQERAGFEIGGNFYLKTHLGFGSLVQATNSVQTTDENPVTIFTLPVLDQKAGRIKLGIQGRKTDGSGRAAFERTFLFYREGAGVQISPKVQSDYTDKTDTVYNILVSSIGNDVVIQVLGKALETINWSGHFEWQMAE